MRYVYVVSDDWHGDLGIYAKQEDATEAVNAIASKQYELSLDEPLDYDSEDRYGWDGVASWRRENVIGGEG